MCHPPQQTVHEQRRALTSNPAWTAGSRRRWDSAPDQLRPEKCWGTAGRAPPPGPGQGQALEGTAGRGGHGHCGLRGFSTPTPHSLQPPPAAARPLPPSRPPGLGGCPATPPLSRESPDRPHGALAAPLTAEPRGPPGPAPPRPKNFRGGVCGRRSLPAGPAAPRTYLRGPPLARGAAVGARSPPEGRAGRAERGAYHGGGRGPLPARGRGRHLKGPAPARGGRRVPGPAAPLLPGRGSPHEGRGALRRLWCSPRPEWQPFCRFRQG